MLNNLFEDKNKEALCNKHLELVLQENQKFNLTSIKDFQQGKLLHIEDSLIPLQDLNNAPNGVLLDLGSGAGFPGIPLSIYSGRQTILIESITKKANFLQQCVNELGIQNNISVFNGRIEDYTIQNKYQASVIVARALSSLPSLLELSSPLLTLDGIFIAYKGNTQQTEETQANNILDTLGMELVNKQQYVLSDNTTKREIFIYKKVEQEKIKLPRKNGLAQKRPLK